MPTQPRLTNVDPRSFALENRVPTDLNIQQLANLILQTTEPVQRRRTQAPSDAAQVSHPRMSLAAAPKQKISDRFPVHTSRAVDVPDSRLTIAPPNKPGKPTRKSLRSDIKQSESSGNYKAVNASSGALGAYQFTPVALRELGYMRQDGSWTGKDGIKSADDFLNSKDVQDKAYGEWIPTLERQLKSNGSWDLVGTDMPGFGEITEAGLLKAAHLGGATGVRRFLTSGTNPSDSLGTHISDYMFGVK